MSRIGNISNSAGVGYTELTGLGLSSEGQALVKLDAAVSESMSDDILKALAEFRKEGNFNPTTAEMEAKLSVVGVAAKQNEINQAQDLLFGLQQTYQFALQQTGGNASTRTQVWCQLVESPGGTVAANALCEGEPSKVAGKTIAGVFGSAVANYPGGPEALLSSLIPATYSSSNGVPQGYWGHGFLTPAVMQTMITALQTKISEMKSADASSFTSATGATSLTARQWLAKELGVDSPHDSYSLSHWGEIAQKLQIQAARKSSQLSLGQGGGIQQVNGQYFVNGEQMSLSQINFCVRANQYQLVDQQIADQLDAIDRNNAKARQAQNVLAAFKTYDSENIGVNQSASIAVSWMIEPNTDASGVIEHYLNTNFGVTASSDPSYRDYSNMIATGSYKQDVRTITDLLTQLPNVTHTASNSATNATSVFQTLAHYLGLEPLHTYTDNAINSKYGEIKYHLAQLAPNFTPPTTAEGWTNSVFTSLTTALTTQKTALKSTTDAKSETMKSQLEGFFGTLKSAASTFYSSHITDTDGGPPYVMTGTMTNADFGDLKTAYGTWLQSNSTDNQVAQQRLESLNNTRQAVLDGMSAFTQGQSQVTDRIGGNL
jgi:hypothetical protein